MAEQKADDMHQVLKGKGLLDSYMKLHAEAQEIHKKGSVNAVTVSYVVQNALAYDGTRTSASPGWILFELPMGNKADRKGTVVPYTAYAQYQFGDGAGNMISFGVSVSDDVKKSGIVKVAVINGPQDKVAAQLRSSGNSIANGPTWSATITGAYDSDSSTIKATITLQSAV
mmetsp:Transcript_48145/g.43165  ORF Transcript_48145/g.43165 Transcript_48145/m.43165 type:complete len:171 (+) Transcript_48145:20-532(+)|eukprot:CAMPEP_0201580608 /NCGR_PEP_ID=MMETSP0190_2-20130828/51690_1 /ASSEMBLY_ACC=CAM_ASM_000263 /TAXON_ID=37353 /ORGANISM="Rosalina sp." /LENGTH=170 /DNA_ID=CAMNT_0048017025 /DNA_START=20 /DNA_END=532 /DNA_ORIENTATION=+